MPTAVIMPKLGLTMEEGTIVAWLVAPGETVEEGQPILEVETDKVVVEVEAPAAGVMGPELAPEGETLAVGAVLAQIYAAGEPLADPRPHPRFTPPPPSAPAPRPHPSPRVPPGPGPFSGAETPPPPAISPPPSPPPGVHAAPPAPGPDLRPGPASPYRQRRFSSPRARKRARELGIDWRLLPGSGPRGRVIERDVLRWAESGPARSDVVAPPWLHLQTTVTLEPLLAIHQRLSAHVQANAGVALTLGDWLLMVAGRMLTAFPALAALRQAEGIHPQTGMVVGLATLPTDLERIARVEISPHMGLLALAQARLQTQEWAEPTTACSFVLVDLSRTRLDTLSFPPDARHSAVLTLGCLRSGQATLSLTCDARVIERTLAIHLLERSAALLEEPYLLWAEGGVGEATN